MPQKINFLNKLDNLFFQNIYYIFKIRKFRINFVLNYKFTTIYRNASAELKNNKPNQD